jgi:hypothetical protein
VEIFSSCQLHVPDHLYGLKTVSNEHHKDIPGYHYVSGHAVA